MKKLLTAAALIAAIFTASAHNDVIIPFDQLPTPAKNFLQNRARDTKTMKIEMDAKDVTSTYEVDMTSGVEFEFDSKGYWSKMDYKGKSFPERLIPTKIKAYLDAKYPNQKVKEIKKEFNVRNQLSGYEVELINGLDLKFNKEEAFIKIDK